jgi:small multidrug resistance pump
MPAYMMLAIAITSNLAAVYFMKLSAGLTLPWPTLAMVIGNLFTLWFLGRVFQSGMNVGDAVMVLTIGVTIGSFVIGLLFGERLTAYQALGAVLAIAGIVISNLRTAQVSPG